MSSNSTIVICITKFANALTCKVNLLALALFILLSYKGYSQTQNLPAAIPATGYNASEDVSPDIKNMLNYYDKQVYFTQNKGQFDSKILYRADFKLGQALATKDGMIVGTFDPADVEAQAQWFTNEEAAHTSHTAFTEPEPRLKGNGWMMNFINHSPLMTVEGNSKHKDVFNYFQGSQKLSDVYSYQEIWYKNVYHKVDVRYYPSKDGSLEYDMICKPGFNEDGIAIKMDGISKVVLKNDGSLVLKTSVGDVNLPTPIAYQNINGQRLPVDVKYVVSKSNIVTFSIGNYDKSKTLLIDPIALRWATWLCTNSTGANHAHCVWVDDSDNIYTVARVEGTSSATISKGAFDVTANGTENLIIGKYTQPVSVGGSGTRVWQTYVGGNNANNPYAAQLGPDGNLYITGYTTSTDFPSTGGTVFNGEPASLYDTTTKTSKTNDDNIFLLKINPGGSSIKGAVIGGNGDDEPYDLRFTSTGDVLICGETSSTDLGTLYGATNTTKSSTDYDVIVFRISPDFNSLRWLKNYGGTGSDVGTIMVDNPGNDAVFVAGYTTSTNFPTTSASGEPAARQTTLGGTEGGFIQELDSSGSTKWSSYFSSASNKSAQILCMEFNTTYNQLFFGGVTSGLASANISAGAYQTSVKGTSAFFVATIDTNQIFVAGTYVGGTNTSGNNAAINMMGLNTDQNNDVYVLAYTTSTAFPTTTGAVQTTNMTAEKSGKTDTTEVFLKLYTDLDSLEYSTYYGGTFNDYDPVGERGIKFSDCRIYTLVTSESDNIPLTQGTLNPTVTSSTSIYEPGLMVWSNPPDLLDNTITGDTVVCKGGEPSGFVGSVPSYSLPTIIRNNVVQTPAYTVGGSATSYQWQSSTDSINWTNIVGGTTQNLSSSQIGDLTVTTYFRRIISGDACIIAGAADQTVKVIVASVGATVTNVTCNGSNNGSITAVPTGPSPYKFTWSTGASSPTISSLSPGTYTVTVTDGNSCTYSNSFIITQPNVLAETIQTQTNPTSCSGASGSITANLPTGGTLPYTYLWSPTGGTGLTASNLTAGTYTITVTDANKCTAIATAILPQPTTINASINATNPAFCSGTSSATLKASASGGTGTFTYTWSPTTGLTPTSGSSVSANPAVTTTYTVTATDVNGCTGTATQVVTIYPIPTISVAPATICYGNSTSLTASGANTYTWSPSAGLSATAGSIVTANPTTTTTYTVNGTSANSCLGTTTVVVTVNPLPTISVPPASICYGNSTGLTASGAVTYTWSPSTGLSATAGSTVTANPTMTTTYTVYGTNSNSCVGTTTVVVTVKETSTSSLTETACSSYTLNGTTYTTSGTYTQYLTNKVGCDSTLTLYLTINKPTTGSLTETACTSYSLNGSTYTSSGQYTQNLTNVAGCDSTLTLNLTINEPTTGSLTETACTSYSLNGSTYTSSGQYTQNLTNVAGCDSTLTLNLTINEPTTGSLTETACTSYSLNGSTYTSSGQYTQNLTNVAGCDSTLTLNLTINEPTTGSLTETACTSYSLNGSTYTSSGQYTQNLTNVAGCDSTLTLNLTINEPTTGSLTETACTSYSLNGSTYTSSGQYTQNLTNVAGCDSTLTLNLTINEPTTGSLTETACTSYSLNGSTYTSSGQYTQNLTNVAGCDSTLTLNLTINEPTTGSLTETACTSYSLNGSTYTSSGQYTQNLTNVAGCDSTLTLNLTINETATGSLTETACSSYTLNGSSYTSTGQYTQNLTSVQGCDSTLTLNLTINEPTTGSLTETACTSYSLNGSTYTSSGQYTQNLTNVAGCDSTLTLNLTIDEPTTGSLTETACSNYTLNGTLYTTSGTYTQYLTNKAGCDSTLTLYLTVNPLPTVSVAPATICYDNSTTLTASGAVSYTWSPATGLSATTGSSVTANPTVTTTYTVIGENGNECSNSTTVIVTVDSLPVVAILGASCSGNYFTVSQGGWGTTCHGNNPGCFRDANFATCFPSGVTIGCSGGNTLSLTSDDTVREFFPQGTTPAVLPAGAMVDNLSYRNIFAGQLVAAELNVGFANCVSGYSGNVGNLIIASGEFSGLTVNQLISISNQVIGGCSTAYSPSDLTDALDNVNTSFDGGTPSGYLTCKGALCVGSSDTLVAVGANSYAWSPSTGLNTTAGSEVIATPFFTTTYTVIGNNGNNCTDTASVVVIVNPLPSVSVPPATICYGNNTTLTASGATTYTWSPATGLNATTGSSVTANPTVTTTYTVTGTNTNGCAGTTTVVVTVKEASTSSLTETSCTSYSLNGSTYTTSGTYTQNLTNVAGCDSTLTLYLTINKTTTGSLTEIACNSYTLNGIQYTTSGTYTQNLTSVQDCDSTLTLYLTINKTTTGSLIEIACNSYTLNGTQYTTSGTYTQNLTSIQGCDSTLTLYLTINQTTTGSLTETACTSYSLNDSTYTKSGTYTQNLTNVAGCDSTLTLYLTINEPTTGSLIETACTSYSLNDSTYTKSGTYTQNLTNVAGCDSTLTLYLTVNQTTTGSLTETACSSYSLNDSTYTKSGTYSQNLTSVQGCDSTLTLYLTINGTSTGSLTETACSSYTLNGTPYTNSGTYTQNLTSVQGCDSTLTLYLTINVPTTSSLTETACGSYSLNNITYTTSGTYTQDFTNSAGCDSTLTLYLTVNPAPIVMVPDPLVLCSGQSTPLTAFGADSYTWNPATGLDNTTGSSVNANPTISTTYQVIGTTNAGCSDTIYVPVIVFPTPVVVVNTPAPICSGNSVALTASGADNYTWNPATGLDNTTGSLVNANPTTTTTYQIIGTFNAGCSDTAYVTVTVNPTPSVMVPDPLVLCSGQSTPLDAFGADTYTWSPATGLDNTTGSSVNANPTTSTTYQVIGTTNAGCADTTYVPVVVFPKPAVVVPTPAPICSGNSTPLTASGADTYTWNPANGLDNTTGSSVNANPTITTTYQVIGTFNAGCSDTISVTVTVNPLPTVSATLTSLSICSGTTDTLTASGATSYTWSPSGSLSASTGTQVIASPSVTTTYTVTGTNGNGCVNTGTATVNVKPAPTVTIGEQSSTICAGAPDTLIASGADSYTWSPATGLSATTGSSVIATPTSSATYAVVGINNSGCVSLNVTLVSITVNPLPSVIITQSDSPICAGETDTLRETGATSYAWTPAVTFYEGLPYVTVSPSVTTTYTVIGTNGNGCTDTTKVVVTVNPLLTVRATSATICYGNSATLTATGAASYTWSPSTDLSATTGSSVTADPTITTTYTVTATNAKGCSNTATSIVTVNPLPTLSVTTPAPICYGTSADLTATGAVSYTWSPSGGLSATSGSSVTADPGATTTYTVTGTNGNDCTNTKTAIVTVNQLPIVSVETPAPICYGTGANLTATGANSYTWSPATGLSATTGSSVTADPSVTTTYTITGTTNNCSNTTTVVVSVSTTTIITSQPVSQTLCSVSGKCGGSNGVTFCVTATGSNLKYRWQFNGKNITDATSSCYTINPVIAADSGKYDVVITGGCGPVTSDTAKLIINSAPVILSQPKCVSVCSGSSATFCVTASGTDITYQWQFNGHNINNATASCYTVPVTSPANTGCYTVVVSNSCGSVTSSVATLTITTPPVITCQPKDESLCAVNGKCSDGVSFCVTASGNNLSYQWQYNGRNINRANSSCYTINPVTSSNAGNYNVIVSNSCGSDTSNIATLTIGNSPDIASQPACTTICSGSNATFCVTASGDNLTYQWQFNGKNINGANSSCYTITDALTCNAGSYDVVVSNSCASVKSNVVTLTINSSPAIICQPQCQTVCSINGKCSGVVTFTVTATGTSLVYQWQFNGKNIKGATSSTYTISPVSASNAGNYDVIVSNTCGSDTSKIATLTIGSTPLITSQPGCLSICSGSLATFCVTATGNNLTYQWLFNGNNIKGATSECYTIASAATCNAGSYSVVVGNSCGSVSSNKATLTINSAPSIKSQPESLTVYTGSSATFSVTATGNGLTYQWQFDGKNINGATSSNYTISSVKAANAGNYDVIVSNTCGAVTSSTATLKINTDMSCNTPTCLAATDVSCNSAQLGWSYSSSGSTFVVEYRVHGCSTWTTITVNTSNFTLTCLNTGTEYDWSVSEDCSCGNTSGYAPVTTFCTSNSCCDNMDAAVIKAGDDTSALVQNFKVYPNPTINATTVEGSFDKGANITILITDISGQVVLSDNETVLAGDYTHQFDLSNLPSGTYFIIIKNGDKMITTKITKINK